LLSSLDQIVLFMVAGVVSLAMLSIVYMSWKNGISPMPSSASILRVVAEEVNRIPGEATIVEAGSGWGTLALYVVRHCPGKRLIGIENSPFPRWCSRLLAWWYRSNTPTKPLTRLTFLRGDLYAFPFETVDVVLCYLYPGAMKRLSSTLTDQLKPDARVISVCFALPGWVPEKVVTCKDMYRTKVYVYAAR
jgi:hypothetical protein